MNEIAESAREVTLHNGVVMPTLAFGCAFGDWVGATEFQGFLPEQAWRAVSLALDSGYRAFDGARAYGTERIVGTLLGQRFASGELTREELFITTKLEIKDDDTEETILDRFGKCQERLRTDYVDALYMHSVPKVSVLDHVGFHKATAKLKADSRLRFVGVSNHGSRAEEEESKE